MSAARTAITISQSRLLRIDPRLWQRVAQSLGVGAILITGAYAPQQKMRRVPPQTAQTHRSSTKVRTIFFS
jgi:hypothetical protein